MRILEVRDGFIKIESEECLDLTSFLRVNSFEKSYIAQIVQVKNSGSVYVAVAKLVYLYNETITTYDKTLPPRDSSVEQFDFANINSSFDVKLPLIPAKYISGENLKLDKDVLLSLLLSIDDSEKANAVISNIFNQSDKCLVIDLQGNIDIADKYTAGTDFKLPLNTSTLQFMYEDCLNDATQDCKGLVKEIFTDLAAYSKSVEFLPFKALKSIVDDMVDKSHIFKLLVFKTKLAKLERLGYYAGTKIEADKLTEIVKRGNAVLDLSKVDIIFQNRYLETIMQILNDDNSEITVITNLSSTVTKKNLKKIILEPKHNTVLSTDSKFKYINEIKSMYKNFIIEPSFANKSVFKPVGSILSGMGKNEVLFVGDASDRLPLVLASEKLELNKNNDTNVNIDSGVDMELTPEEAAIVQKSDELISQISNEVKTEDVNGIENLFDDTEDEPEEEQQEVYDTPLESGNDYHTQVDTTKAIEAPEEVLTLDESDYSDEANEGGEDVQASDEELEVIEIESDVAEADGSIQQEQISDYSDQPAEDIIEPETDEIANVDEADTDMSVNADNFTVEEISESDMADDNADFDEIVDFNENELTDDAILVDLDENPEVEAEGEDELDKEIVEDVDKVYTTIKDDTISDEDLDFIDELNGDITVTDEELVISDDFEPVQELTEENDEPDFLEPLEEVGSQTEQSSEEKEILETKNSTTPIVPVYDAEIPQEDRVVSDLIEQGDTVVHAKYGTGVVEKMIKYGAKNLYSINFDNVGRRLLDPTLTEIKKA